ncbi:hypothetical protein BGZ61DRAFT_452057 [Ilyonectria robusta]|uniref:uncharacterized protein n=1 Tax=Ilyonectria robusta TaxID=1079257 RepID=UPI001E8E5798|nr:uncharacterized protein BGZ61DRAFT_452057 [Ilyonectria robusta]KAH8694532.1 hypothetical protein BGZ61DRAFT_452057 [Ilyonectria robusta]
MQWQKAAKSHTLSRLLRLARQFRDHYIISMVNLWRWNPGIGSACKSLWAQLFLRWCLSWKGEIKQ